jgi:Na+-transporting NADH:ubiquinone oxidoreductase subunit NqrB
MKKIAIEIKWGIIFTMAGLLWMFLEKSLGWHDELISKHPIYTMLFAVIAIVIFVFALRDKKMNFFQNDMNWKQGFLSGCIVSLVVTILSPISQYISSEIISPNYFQNAINYAVENNRMTLEDAQAFFNLKSYMFQAAFGGLSMGIVTSAIVAFFMKSK